MDSSPINSLLIDVMKRVAADHPQLAAQVDEYLACLALTDERDEQGKLTQAAHNARAKLRNPLLNNMPVKRARRQIEKAARKKASEAQKKVAEALHSWAEWQQYEAELNVLQEGNRKPADGVEPSRESHDIAATYALVQPFIDGLQARGIAASAIGRLSDLHKDLFAKLIVCERKDPDFLDPGNPWVQMGQAGILDAFREAMTVDQARAVECAKTLEDCEGIERADLVRELNGLGPGFSLRFLLGVINLRVCLGKITDGAARTYSQALRLAEDQDAELLGRVLGLTDDADKLRLRTLVDFLWRSNNTDCRDLNLEVQVVAVQQAFERLAAHQRSTSDWSRDAIRMISSLAENLAGEVPGSEAFEMLLASGFRLSATYQAVEQLQQERAEAREWRMIEEQVARAVWDGLRFKVDGTFVFTERDYMFEDLDGPVWDEDSWIAAHGPIEALADLAEAAPRATPEDEVHDGITYGDKLGRERLSGSVATADEPTEGDDLVVPDPPASTTAADGRSAAALGDVATATDVSQSPLPLFKFKTDEISEEDLR